jgi:hypothetical protein
MMFPHKDVESIEEDDDAKVSKCEICCIWLKGTFESKSVPIHALCFQSIVKADIGNADTAPSEQECNSGQVLEPREDNCRSTWAN